LSLSSVLAARLSRAQQTLPLSTGGAVHGPAWSRSPITGFVYMYVCHHIVHVILYICVCVGVCVGLCVRV
jgi:hypothetical protein